MMTSMELAEDWQGYHERDIIILHIGQSNPRIIAYRPSAKAVDRPLRAEEVKMASALARCNPEKNSAALVGKDLSLIHI